MDRAGSQDLRAHTIGSKCQIGANAVVNRSFAEDGITIAGVPARKVSAHANPHIRKFLLDGSADGSSKPWHD